MRISQLLSMSALAILALAMTALVDAEARPRAQNKPFAYDRRQSKSGCEKYTWSIAREKAWFEQAETLKLKSGDKRADIPGRAFVLSLDSDTDASLVMPLERKPRGDNGFGGSLSFDAVPRAGLYQITLSEDALIDVIQDGHYLRKKGSIFRRDCPGIRRSIRVELAAEPLVLQLGGVEQPWVNVAISLVE